MMPQTLQDLERVFLSVLNDAEISEIMYRRRMPSGAPMLNEFRDAVNIAVEAINEALAWRRNAEAILNPEMQP